MTSRDFCFWLQGFMEIGQACDPSRAPNLNHEQLLIVKNHLAMVFKHEIDPSMGPKPHQDALNHLHQGGTNPDVRIRC